MSSLNQVNLIGRVGKDAEVYNNTTVFSLATSQSWIDKKGEQRKETEWHRCVCYGKLAEVAANYIKKGMQIFVTGSIKTNDYQNQKGENVRSIQIVVNNIVLLGSGSSTHASSASGKSHAASPYKHPTDSDIPF